MKKNIIFKIKKITFVLGIAFLLVLMAFINAYSNGLYADFYPLNGDFQNYNPIRRFLAGQRPFVDFEVYLGMGHLLSGSFFTRILGGDFQASIYAMRIVTFLAFEITVLIIFLAVIRSKKAAIVLSLLVSSLNLVCLNNALPIDMNALIPDAVETALQITRIPGNSARLIRSCICVIAPGAIVCLLKLLQKSFERYAISASARRHIAVGIVGGIAGISIFWSNDYGISSALTIMLIAGIICLKEVVSKKEGIRSILIDLLLVVCCFVGTSFIIACLITKGHPLSYLNITLQVSQYQSWYAVHSPYGKAYYLWDIIIWDGYPFVALGLGIAYIIYYLKSDGALRNVKRYLVPSATLISGFFAVHLYRISDGGGTEYFWILILVVILAEMIRLVERRIYGEAYCSERSKGVVISVILIAAIMISSLGAVITTKIETSMEGTYVEGLGGYLHSLGDSIINTQNKLGDATVFNTYASAVEAVTNQYQPSGADYIIHVLGDQEREKYIEKYEEADADYVGVIREDFAAWEGYIRGANWFFYREMLNDRVICFSNRYQNYYSKSNEQQITRADCSIDIEQRDIDTVVVTLRFPDSSYNGLADVKLGYSMELTQSRRNLFCFRQLGHVHDVNYPEELDFYYDIPLPEDHESEYIPVIIKNGVGQIVITSHPDNYTQMSVDDVECYGIFLNALDICMVKSVTINEDGNYVISVEGNKVDGFQSYVRIQHENDYVEIIDYSFDGEKTNFVIDNKGDFAENLDDMSAIKLLNR